MRSDIIRENLSVISAEEMRITEKRLYEISELSREFYGQIKDSLTGEELEPRLHRDGLEALLCKEVEKDGVPSEYVPFLEDKERTAFSTELAAFSLFLSERIRDDGIRPLWWRERHTKRARIAYVPSSRSEKVYLALAELRREASVFYASSAADAISALLARKADYAMLPYMAANGELLSGTSQLWMQHELSLSALVALSEGEEKLVYALFSAEISPFTENAPVSLCLSVTVDTYEDLGRILSAIPLFGYAQTALTAGGDEYGRVRARITLEGNGDMTALWLYLSFYSVGTFLLGRYSTIEI